MTKTKHIASKKRSLNEESPSKQPSPLSSPSLSQTLATSSSSSGTPSPVEKLTPKRIPKPTQKVLDKGKAPMKEPEKPKKRKAVSPPGEKLLKDAIKSSNPKPSQSSPKTKKPKKPSTSSTQIEDEDLLVILPDKEERIRYLKAFAHRKIHDARVVDFAYFDSKNFTFQDHLRTYNMINFLTTSVDYYPRLIRIFYSNFQLLKNGFQTEVKGKKIKMTYQEFSKLTGLPYYSCNIDGRINDESDENAWEHQLVRSDIVRAIMEDGFVEKTTLPVGQMKIQHRLLLYVITKFLVPRSHNFSVVQQVDQNLLWGMIYDLPMSWTWIIITTMNTAAQTAKTALPYPQLITTILKKFKVPLANEEKVTKNSLFGEAIINQMGLKFVRDKWTWGKAPNAPVEEDPGTKTVNTILETLQQFISAQELHNAQVSSALADLQERMKAVEHHLSIQMSFDDIAHLGAEVAQQATQAEDAEVQQAKASKEADLAKETEAVDVDPSVVPTPLGEETPTEDNTVVSTSSLASKED